MDLTRMCLGIIKIINDKYQEYLDDDCLDIIQIKNICNLYKNKSSGLNSVSLQDIQLSSPDFKKTNFKDSKKQLNTLKTPEFQKKYAFFIRIIYSCLKMDIEIFDTRHTTLILKNNYCLIKSLEAGKKQMALHHINCLKSFCRNPSPALTPEYESYCGEFILKVKIIDKMIKSINKLIDSRVFDKTDNLFSLILPYFYTYAEYIEEYNTL